MSVMNRKQMDAVRKESLQLLVELEHSAWLVEDAQSTGEDGALYTALQNGIVARLTQIQKDIAQHDEEVRALQTSN
jgi:hypothetical protein